MYLILACPSPGPWNNGPLGEGERQTNRVVRSSLNYMRRFHRRSEGLGYMAISKRRRHARLGPSALSTIAYLTCRERAGRRHDALIGRLARFIVAMQREESIARRFM